MTSLENISRILLDEQISLEMLESTLKEYKALVLTMTSLDLNKNTHLQHLQLDSGIAIGLQWAASCLDDGLRTHKFLLGTKQAIDQKLSSGSKPVKLVYAGTGPFATLALPLLAHFSSEELRVTLIEVNPESAASVSRVLKRLGLENHVEEIFCADATSFALPNSGKWQNYQFDILLSETMQHALQAELQVPICANLINRMSEEAILIPQSIQLALIELRLESGKFVPIENLGEIMKVDADFLRKEGPMNQDWVFTKQMDLSSTNDNSNHYLGIDTTIHVFRDLKIQRNESGLTIPKIIGPLSDFRDSHLTARYVISPEPGIHLQVPE